MKIKLAILEKDRAYLSRIVTTFGMKYSDKLETYSFTDYNSAFSTLIDAKIDVLLASDAFDVDMNCLPKRCAFAYFVDSNGIEMQNGQRAICKFQKVDQIYKQILSIYAEKASSITGFKAIDDNGKIIVFCSASGGVGSSTMAAACAALIASQGKNALYLNLEKFGSADIFFSGQGQFSMSDIIFALKSKKTNLPMKLESCVKQDQSGVYFYSQANIALDMMELNVDDTIRLLSELKLMGEYDYIIVDIEFAINQEMLAIYRKAESIIMVSDGSRESNMKTERAYSALAILEQNSDDPLTNRMSLIYDKVSSKSGQAISIPGLKMLGGAPRYSGADSKQIVSQLATMSIFDTIL